MALSDSFGGIVDGGLDVDKILSTNIPDLAPVYGGFRGRTLSSSKQRHDWNTLLEAGIHQVIDLRADYKSDSYHDMCINSGIGYYHYPIAYDEASVDNMVKEFPVFCSLIDKGGFYIACAMGLYTGSARTTDPKSWKRKYLDGHRP